MLNPKLRYYLSCFRAIEKDRENVSHPEIIALKERFHTELKDEHPLTKDNIYALLLELLGMKRTDALDTAYLFLRDGYMEEVNAALQIKDLHGRTLLHTCAQLASVELLAKLVIYFPHVKKEMEADTSPQSPLGILKMRAALPHAFTPEQLKQVVTLFSFIAETESATETDKKSLTEIFKAIEDALGGSRLHAIAYYMELDNRASVRGAFEQEVSILSQQKELSRQLGPAGENILVPLIQLGQTELLDSVLRQDNSEKLLKSPFFSADPVVVAALNVRYISGEGFVFNTQALQVLHNYAKHIGVYMDYQERLGSLLLIPEVSKAAHAVAGRSLREFKPRFVGDYRKALAQLKCSTQAAQGDRPDNVVEGTKNIKRRVAWV